MNAGAPFNALCLLVHYSFPLTLVYSLRISFFSVFDCFQDSTACDQSGPFCVCVCFPHRFVSHAFSLSLSLLLEREVCLKLSGGGRGVRVEQ